MERVSLIILTCAWTQVDAVTLRNLPLSVWRCQPTSHEGSFVGRRGLSGLLVALTSIMGVDSVCCAPWIDRCHARKRPSIRERASIRKPSPKSLPNPRRHPHKRQIRSPLITPPLEASWARRRHVVSNPLGDRIRSPRADVLRSPVSRPSLGHDRGEHVPNRRHDSRRGESLRLRRDRARFHSGPISVPW